ncbi:MAG TPA: RibD family protein [Methanobacteriaceae archaeon]|nr:RibD family protein [Methanobacteriaceae archaeon]
MLPWVVVFNAISLDGRITGFDANVELYYKLASKIAADAMLMGCETVLKEFNAQPDDLPEEDGAVFQPRNKDPEDKRPLLVVPDSEGKIRIWSQILKMPYIKDIIVLCSRSTPKEYLDFLDERYVPYMVVGYEKVDLEAALNELNAQFDVKVVRVDGGVLNSVLLQKELVDEVHVMIHPTLAGNGTLDSIYNKDLDLDKNKEISLKLIDFKHLNDDIVYLSYEILK